MVITMEFQIRYLFMLAFMSLVVNTAIALYGIFARPSLIKKIIAVTIFSDSLNLLAIMVGFAYYPSFYPIPPILTKVPNPTQQDIEKFVSSAVDPLPQALVLTAIVIGLAVILFLITLTLQIYRLYGTTDVRKISKLKG